MSDEPLAKRPRFETDVKIAKLETDIQEIKEILIKSRATNSIKSIEEIAYLNLKIKEDDKKKTDLKFNLMRLANTNKALFMLEINRILGTNIGPNINNFRYSITETDIINLATKHS